MEKEKYTCKTPCTLKHSDSPFKSACPNQSAATTRETPSSDANKKKHKAEWNPAALYF